MYEAFFGLNRKPFSLQPDSSFMYLGRRHKLALHLLQYGLLEETGFTVITGEIGAGKTTLIQYLMKNILENVEIGVVHHTHAAFGTIMRSIASVFQVEHDSSDNQIIYEAFVRKLEALHADGKRAILIVDEAQNLSADTLEERRMLSNVNSGERFLLQVILVGQPQLLATLKKPELVQLVQRVGISYHLETFELPETLSYIRHRLDVAGGKGDLFDDLSCAAVHYFSNGTPRLINQLCDLSLVYAYGDDGKSVTFETVCEVAENRIGSGLSAFQSVPDGRSIAGFKQDLLDDLYGKTLGDGEKPGNTGEAGGNVHLRAVTPNEV